MEEKEKEEEAQKRTETKTRRGKWKTELLPCFLGREEDKAGEEDKAREEKVNFHQIPRNLLLSSLLYKLLVMNLKERASFIVCCLLSLHFLSITYTSFVLSSHDDDDVYENSSCSSFEFPEQEHDEKQAHQ